MRVLLICSLSILCLLLNVVAHGLGHNIVLSAADASLQEQYEADELLRAMEDRILEIEAMPAAERYRNECKLGSKLARLERKIRNTKANNKVLYLLANWQITYDLNAAWPTIEQLQKSPYLPHKGTLDLAKIRYHLKKGDTEKARRLAEKITDEVPEFITTIDLVTLYETRGDEASRYKGKHLSGPYAEPLIDAPEAFIVYIFTNLNDEWQQFHIQTYCTELQRKEYQGKFHVVCVSFDSKYINALGNWQDMRADQDWDLFWANPSRKGDAEDWKVAWKVHTIPAYVLVGPQREVLEINPTINELRTLAGIKKSKTSSASNSSKKNRKGRRGKKGPRW